MAAYNTDANKPNWQIIALRRADELTRLQSEVERLRGRCERLQAAVPWTIYGDNLTATVLRKQAEALIEFGYRYGPESIVRRLTQEDAQRLRQKADEIEKTGG